MMRKITPIQLLQLLTMAALGMGLAAGTALSTRDGARTVMVLPAEALPPAVPGACFGGAPDGVCSGTEKCEAIVTNSSGATLVYGCSDCGNCCGGDSTYAAPCGSPYSTGTYKYVENCDTCPDDCPAPNGGGCCGNGTCDDGSGSSDDFGESCSMCPDDCGVCPPSCGDGNCDTADGETCLTCSTDCTGACCGNGACETGETTADCPGDCPAVGSCNNDGVCGGASVGEDCTTCPNDCETQGSNCCGDGVCGNGESCDTDCGTTGGGGGGGGGGGCGTTIPPANDANYGVQSGCDLDSEEEQALYDLVEELLEGASQDANRVIVTSANVDSGVIETASQCCTDSGTPYTASGTTYEVPSFLDCDMTCIDGVKHTYYSPDPADAVHANGLDGAGILAIEGTLQVNGGCWWYGIIVVRGDMTFAGGGNNSTNIQGAVLTQETATFGGSFTLTLDYCAIEMATDPGSTVPTGELVAWRDI